MEPSDLRMLPLPMPRSQRLWPWMCMGCVMGDGFTKAMSTVAPYVTSWMYAADPRSAPRTGASTAGGAPGRSAKLTQFSDLEAGVCDEGGSGVSKLRRTISKIHMVAVTQSVCPKPSLHCTSLHA